MAPCAPPGSAHKVARPRHISKAKVSPNPPHTLGAQKWKAIRQGLARSRFVAQERAQMRACLVPRIYSHEITRVADSLPAGRARFNHVGASSAEPHSSLQFFRLFHFNRMYKIGRRTGRLMRLQYIRRDLIVARPPF